MPAPANGYDNDLKFEYDASQRVTRQYEYWTGRTPTVRNDKKTQYDLANRVVCQYLVGSTDGCNSTSPARIEYAYDKADRLTHEIQDGRDVGYAYDAAGNRTSITWPDGKAATYSYDARGMLSAVGFEGTSLATYTYDRQGRATAASFGNGNSASTSYSADDLLTALSYALKDESGASQTLSWAYTYTNAHRLASSDVNVAAHRWSPPANVTTTYSSTTLTGEAANAVDQYEQIAESINAGTPSNSTLTYDVRGNLTGDGTWTYTYDLENRMTQAVATGTTATYDYDPMGRRIAKTVNGTKTSFLRAGSAEIAEYDGSGNLLRRYIPGIAPDSFVAWVEGTGTTAASIKWIAADRQGSTAAVTDNSGKVAQRFAYDPYGNEIAGAPGTGFPFRYTGQRFDPETGLYYYKARCYSPKLGRFCQTDPIGYKDQLNLYAYVGNDPNNGTDPTGLASFMVCRAIVKYGVNTGQSHCFILVTKGEKAKTLALLLFIGIVARQFAETAVLAAEFSDRISLTPSIRRERPLLDDIVESADVIARVRITSAEKAFFPGISCGHYYEAHVLEALKGPLTDVKFLASSELDNVQVDKDYLVFLHKRDVLAARTIVTSLGEQVSRPGLDRLMCLAGAQYFLSATRQNILRFVITDPLDGVVEWLSFGPRPTAVPQQLKQSGLVRALRDTVDLR